MRTPPARSIPLTLALGLILAGGVALAQQKATDPAVIARQNDMDTIAANMKILGEMASGKAAFDAAKAGTAAQTLAAAADNVPTVFKSDATEPASKASPKIWTDWEGFLRHAEDLRKGAHAIDASSLDSLKATLGGAGGTCRSCHSEFRT